MKTRLKKGLSKFLVICLALSSLSVPAFAAPENQELENGLETEITTDIEQSSDEYVDEGTVSEGTSSMEQPETDAALDDSVISEKEVMTEEDAVVSESLLAEETAEEVFEETGIFGISVEDRNNVKINPWYDISSDTYYLFLTNAINISELSLQITGIRIEETSAGTLDTKTNSVTGAFVQSGDGITLTAKDGQKYTVIVKQSDLPSLSISLNGITLEQLNAGSKDDKYPGQSVILTDASGNVNVSQENVELKGRGNSTWTFSEKKPYQIKFAKRQSVLGMESAKKWVLLANAFDDTMLRNETGFHLGKSLGMAYTPGAENVELWIDGEYRGLYTVGGKCEIDSNRLNLTDPLGALTEVDNFFYSAEDYWFSNTDLGSYFVLSDCVDENQSSEALENLQYKLMDFTKYLLNTDPANYSIDSLQKYISVDDFAKWYLINEYLRNSESAVTSWYWYTDGPSDVLHLGPLWDFDSSQNNTLDGQSVSGMDFKHSTVLFKKLIASPAFSSCVKTIFKDNRSVFSSLSSMVYSLATTINVAADSNYTRWHFLGASNQKNIGKRFEGTYTEAVSSLANWLIGRDQAFFIDVPASPSATISTSVSDSGRFLTVCASDLTVNSNVSVAVWSATKGQDDLKWYPLNNNTDGTMSVEVDLKNHGSSDTYYAHVYCGNTFLGADTLAITMQDMKTECTASYSEKSGLIHIDVKNIMDYSELKTAVWTSVNGQDDLKWITKKVNGKKELAFDVDYHSLKGDGRTEIHVYGTVGSKMIFLTSTSVVLTEPLSPEIEAKQTGGGNIIDISATNMSGFSSATVAVWGDSNGQNDLKWYTMKKNSDGTWSASVDFTTHKETGLFHIHVYGMKNNKNTFANKTTVTTTAPLTPVLKVTTIVDGEKFRASLENASGCTSVSFAVWGEKDSQNDLKWYTAKKTVSGNWIAEIPVKNHMETGLYYVHAYGVSGGKSVFQSKSTFNVEKLPNPVITTNLYPSGKTLRLAIGNTGAFNEIKAAVWGSVNGQNDLKWYSLSSRANGRWEKLIDLNSHNETGEYNIHLYGIMNKKMVFIGSRLISVDEFKKPVITCIDKGSYFLAKSEYTEEYEKVRFAVWTEDKGQDDLKWYTGALYSDGSYRFFINYAAHGGNGKYNIHAYGTLAGKENYLGKYILNKADLQKPVITTALNADQTKLTIEVQDTIGYSSASVAIWGSANGQNDLKWYTLTKQGSDRYTTTINIANHKEKGTFNIHVYGKEAGKQFFMNSTTITIK